MFAVTVRLAIQDIHCQIILFNTQRHTFINGLRWKYQTVQRQRISNASRLNECISLLERLADGASSSSDNIVPASSVHVASVWEKQR